MLRSVLIASLSIAAPALAAERTATGSFEVKMTGEAASQMTMAKTYSGALAGRSTGPFVGDEKVMVYVALEKFEGELDGRRGSCIMMHRGWQGGDKVSHLDVQVAPNSGTGELSGISGSLAIRIDAAGKHFYTLRYSLPQP